MGEPTEHKHTQVPPTKREEGGRKVIGSNQETAQKVDQRRKTHAVMPISILTADRAARGRKKKKGKK